MDGEAIRAQFRRIKERALKKIEEEIARERSALDRIETTAQRVPAHHRSRAGRDDRAALDSTPAPREKHRRATAVA